jgi:hypothetical protein
MYISKEANRGIGSKSLSSYLQQLNDVQLLEIPNLAEKDLLANNIDNILTAMYKEIKKGIIKKISDLEKAFLNS